MLAAESAWMVLRAEHACMRELLSEIDEELHSHRWQHSQQQPAPLQRLVRCLRSFDDAVHRPKGVLLLQMLRGRSADVDRLLAQLEAESRQCDGQLTRALSLLERVQQGDHRAAKLCTSLLQQHRTLMLHHLEEEDTVLLPHTARLLTAEDWSSVASWMSTVAEQKPAARR